MEAFRRRPVRASDRMSPALTRSAPLRRPGRLRRGRAGPPVRVRPRRARAPRRPGSGRCGGGRGHRPPASDEAAAGVSLESGASMAAWLSASRAASDSADARSATGAGARRLAFGRGIRRRVVSVGRGGRDRHRGVDRRRIDRAAFDDLAVQLEHRRERRDGRCTARGLGREVREARGVAIAAVTLVAHHLAVAQLDHATLHLVDEARLVRRHHDRGPARIDASEQLHDVSGCRGVEVSGRLVGEQHLRPVDERARDRDALLLAAGQLVREAALLALEARRARALRARPAG